MSFCTQTRDTPYSRATSLLLRPSIVTAVITSRAIDMAHLRAKEGANYVPRHLLTMSCNQSPSPAPHRSIGSARLPVVSHTALRGEACKSGESWRRRDAVGAEADRREPRSTRSRSRRRRGRELASLDWWVKDRQARQEGWGRVRGADGRQRWIKALDLRPASGSQP